MQNKFLQLQRSNELSEDTSHIKLFKIFYLVYLQESFELQIMYTKYSIFSRAPKTNTL